MHGSCFRGCSTIAGRRSVCRCDQTGANGLSLARAEANAQAAGAAAAMQVLERTEQCLRCWR